MHNDSLNRRAFLGRAAGLSLAGVLGAAGAFAQDAEKKKKRDDWKQLFNGKDLDGWKPEGKADWKVENGMLIGRQGPGNAPGDLFTVEEYGDFVLVVEYKVQWPANSGVWFRYVDANTAYQADILEYKDPVAYSGTLYCPGRMFLGANLDPSLEKRDDWNTMKIRCEGEHMVITLNGKVTVDVKDNAIPKGRIGFQIHPGDEFKDMQFSARKIQLRAL